MQRGAQKSGRQLPAGLEVELPYYGDVLDNLASGRNGGEEGYNQRQREQPGLGAFFRDLGDEYLHKLGTNGKKIDIDGEATHARTRLMNSTSMERLIRVFDKYTPSVSEGTIKEFVRDVWAYLTRPGIQDEINNIVAGAFTERPAVVVGHSLGSIVAYQVLRTDRRPLKISLYVTIGSPLGLRAISQQLWPRRFPASIAAWYNARDKTDYIALNPLDPNNFPFDRQNPGVAPTIENYDGVRHETPDRHDVVGYLDDPTVARGIVDTLIA